MPPTPVATNGVAAWTEPGAAAAVGSTETTDAVTAEPVTAPPPKKVKHPATGPNANAANAKDAAGLGTVFKKLFNTHTGANYFPSRGRAFAALRNAIALTPDKNRANSVRLRSLC